MPAHRRTAPSTIYDGQVLGGGGSGAEWRVTRLLTTSARCASAATRRRTGRRGSVKGVRLALTPGAPPESSHCEEQQGAPPFPGRPISSSSALAATARCAGVADRSCAAAWRAESRQIGQEHTWRPPTIAPRHRQRCSAARARGTSPAAPERTTIISTAASRLGKSVERPLSTLVR